MIAFEPKMTTLNAYFPHGRFPRGEATRLLRQFESAWGQLPPDYCDFVLEWGGSAFRQKVAFTIRGETPFGNEGLLDAFYGLSPNSTYELSSNAKMYADRLPSGLVPVAQDPGSNQICIGSTNAPLQGVFFWDKESESFPGSIELSNSDAAWRISDTWSEFIELLNIWKRPSR